MSDTEARAPVLSTYQDTATFEYAKVRNTEQIRNHLGPHVGKTLDEEVVAKIKQYYSLDELVEFLKQKSGDELRFKKVTLQFPDSLICDSATIVHELQRHLGHTFSSAQKFDAVEPAELKSVGCCSNGNNCSAPDVKGCCNSSSQETASQAIWILADTSYSACCVDEVAAEHVHSDLVVHFGDACLNPIEKLPVAYVFGKPYLDEDKVIEEFRKTYQDRKEDRILLMSDACNVFHARRIWDTLKGEFINLAFADVYLNPATSKDVEIIGYSPMTHESSEHSSVVALNRQLIGIKDVEALNQYDLFHISLPQAPRLLQLTTKFQSVTIYNVDEEKIHTGSHPNLMRRYRYVHMARSAGTIGLLVNTLSLANTKTLMNSIAKKIRDAGKKHYLFVVGKPNVAKLANFENVDLWCILGCDHQGIIVDQNNEYFKPIVTPYELLLALSDDLTWTGQWVTDFNEVLKDLGEGSQDQKEEEGTGTPDDNEAAGEDSDDDAPQFDPVTGKYVSTSRPLRKLQHLQITAEEEGDDDKEEEESEKSLIKKFSSTVAIKDTVSTSAMYLQTRTWTGLGSDYKDNEQDEEGAILEDGRGGIARGYDFDIENKN
ncbi:2-(3-amino-3-carboxypropyl)histidine synthase subunit 2 [[Candida] railenensis]|uniref:2-(3-amino-3-carboxypropyl)histidine synthase subunit 2 n=1 Tax=[Candida] railenensis TaxID=45579 RepID=A0A9P0VWH8_9ASCO|nr:2-(3-amino-3-carboxypropyl)histidine synthase subunit 2 [[Candida] railenensis]